jgi:hypothetical protein
MSTLLDPRREPNRWLAAMFDHLLQVGDADSLDSLRSGYYQLCNVVEPGLIDSLFQPWIEAYLQGLQDEDGTENIQNIQRPPQGLEDLPEPLQ